MQKKDKIKVFYDNHREFILYSVFGVVTTLANFFSYLIMKAIFGEERYLINNAVAWLVGVVVAFVTNKLFVFSSKSWKLKIALKEFAEFVAARLFSFGVEEAGMWLFMSVLNFSRFSIPLVILTVPGDIIAKLLISIVVVILNYFFSKFIIFKKNKEK